MLLATDRDRWAGDDRWLRQALDELGFPSAATSPEAYGVMRAWRVRLAPQMEVELGIADTLWARPDPVDAGTRRVVTDGLKPLVDKDGLLRALVGACHKKP